MDVSRYLQDTAAVLTSIDAEQVTALLAELNRAWDEDRAVLICGNGGSAATASHMACDLAKQTMMPGRRPLRALALTDNVSLMSAWGNDAGFAHVFAEQVNVHARPGDVLVCLSASGDSPNIVAAAETAAALGMTVVGLGGFTGGRLREVADIYVHVPANDYGLVESAHLVLEHCLTTLIRHGQTPATVRSSNGDRQVVLVDRDGVINRNLDKGVRSWAEFEFLPGAIDGLAELSRHGHRVIVITNQANIARGHLTPARLDDIHRRMLAEVAAEGGQIEAIYVCQHLPEDGCECRRPRPGLIQRAADERGFSTSDAYVVGDHASDVEAAVAAGAEPVLVLSGRGRREEFDQLPRFVADDLRQAAQLIVAANGNGAQIHRPQQTGAVPVRPEGG